MSEPAGFSIIRAEYRRLCHVLGLREVPVDLYEPDLDSHTENFTAFGSDRRNGHPMYSGTRKLMVLPVSHSDQPARLPTYPPETWVKEQWEVWRFELWHEVIHQVSDEVLDAWDPHEPGYVRDDGSTSEKGHGVGFRRALDYVAAKLETTRRELEKALDQ